MNISEFMQAIPANLQGNTAVSESSMNFTSPVNSQVYSYAVEDGELIDFDAELFTFQSGIELNEVQAVESGADTSPEGMAAALADLNNRMDAVEQAAAVVRKL